MASTVYRVHSNPKISLLWTFLVGGVVIAGGVLFTSASEVRVVTWNVNNNKQMQGIITTDIIDDLLGFNLIGDNGLSSVYAIALQENCWLCNNLTNLAQRFLQRVEKVAPGKYSVVGVAATMDENDCKLGCLDKKIGTTVLIVIAEKLLGTSQVNFKQVELCAETPREKGVVGMQYTTYGSGRVMCFAALQLESSTPTYRRQCMKNFFEVADREVNWTSSCDVHYVFGDFNIRTGKDNDITRSKDEEVDCCPKGIELKRLKVKDELTGSNPYSSDSNWDYNLLSYINKIQNQTFVEETYNFPPTYSVLPKTSCGSKFPCYNGEHPKSWPDRVIYTNSECEVYNAIHLEKSEHYPVYALFTIDMTPT